MAVYLEKKINSGKGLVATRFFLSLASGVLRFLPAYAAKSEITDARILLQYKTKNLAAAEKVIFQFSRYQSPSTWAVNSYIARVVNLGLDKHSSAIKESKFLREDLKPLLSSAIRRRDGDLEGALQALEYKGKSYQVRTRIAQARRGIFHQMQDYSRLASEGLTFLQSEPAKLLIPFAVTTAGSAENAKLDDVFSPALRRLLDDRDRIVNNRNLLKNWWKDAVTASLTVFDIDGAIETARLAKMAGVKLAGARMAELMQLRDEVLPWRYIIDAAHTSFRVKAYGHAQAYNEAKVELVIPAAALRSSANDYPGFRSELRFVVKVIAETLTTLGIPFRVRGRIRTHGELSFPIPSISYHTISLDPKALHFKETDRPSRFSFDTGGYAGWSDFSSKSIRELNLENIDHEEALSYFRAEQLSIIQGEPLKYAQRDSGSEEFLPEKFVFVSFQGIGETVQQLAYMTPFLMMDEIIETCLQKNLAIVVKPPLQDKNGQFSEYLRHRAENGDITLSSSGIHTLIEKSEAVCVVNSSVGAEALLHEKPVYIFGRADYMQACFVCEASGDFARQFEVGTTRLPSEELHRFWFVLRNHYAISLLDSERSAQWIRDRVIRHLKEQNVLPSGDIPQLKVSGL